MPKEITIPEFTEKTAEQLDKMNTQELLDYRKSQREFETATIRKELQDQIKELNLSGDVENKSKIEALEAQSKTLLKGMEDLGLMFKAISEKPTQENVVSLKSELKANMEAIRKIASGGSGEVALKADTVRASISDNGQAYDIAGIGQLAHRKLSLYDLFPKITIGESNNAGIVRYYDWDEATTVRAAASVAETGTFPESTAKWKTYTLPLEKVGDTLPVSEEFYEDEAMFASELDHFLRTNVDLVVDSQLATGDGTSNTLKGLISSSTAFNSALVSTAPDATFYDLLAIAPEQITITGGSKYTPNFAVMRKTMINKMRLTKDLNENYIIPPFVTRDGKEVDGMIVVESNVMPDNTLVLGDSNFAKIYQKGGIEMAKAPVGDQFVEDMETLKVRKRMLFLIRNADKGGFIYISDVDAAITAITAT